MNRRNGISASDQAVVIGIIAIGVHFGIKYMHNIFGIDINSSEFAFQIIQYVLYIGILLLGSGIGYKIIKWKLSS